MSSNDPPKIRWCIDPNGSGNGVYTQTVLLGKWSSIVATWDGNAFTIAAT